MKNLLLNYWGKPGGRTLLFACLILSMLGSSNTPYALASPAVTNSDEAYFVFALPMRPETFVVKLTEAEKIKQARDILSGIEKKTTSIGGVIVKSPACYNIPWSFHLEPQSVVFLSGAIEVCEASIQYIEDHLGEVGDAFLPGSRWCAIDSRLLKEIPAPDCPASSVTSTSAASYSRTKLAAEGIAAAFGSNLSVATEIASSLPLPTTLAGTTVKVKDNQGVERLSPLLFVSPTQINYIIPKGTAPGMVAVTVTNARGEEVTGKEMIMAVGPGFFTFDATGKGIPTALVLRVKQGKVTYEPIARYDEAQQKLVLLPIDLGTESEQVFLVLFGTGFRPSLPLPGAEPAAFIGDTFVEPLYIGPQPNYPGLDQVNLPIPRSLIGKGEVEIRMVMDDKSANPVRVHIK